MPSFGCQGIILKRRNFGEADRMLTILTDRFGKISVVARGVRKITSRRAGNVELLNNVRLHVFKAKGYTLTEAESLQTYQIIKANITLSTYAFHVLELVDRLLVEDTPNKQLYDLTRSVLQLLETHPRQIFLRAYEVKVLSLMGFWSSRELPEIDQQTKQLLRQLEFNSWAEIDQLDINQAQAETLEMVLKLYLEKVLESSLKSLAILKQLKK